jgi:hypothetical protein
MSSTIATAWGAHFLICTPSGVPKLHFFFILTTRQGIVLRNLCWWIRHGFEPENTVLAAILPTLLASIAAHEVMGAFLGNLRGLVYNSGI